MVKILDCSASLLCIITIFILFLPTKGTILEEHIQTCLHTKLGEYWWKLNLGYLLIRFPYIVLNNLIFKQKSKPLYANILDDIFFAKNNGAKPKSNGKI